MASVLVPGVLQEETGLPRYGSRRRRSGPIVHRCCGRWPVPPTTDRTDEVLVSGPLRRSPSPNEERPRNTTSGRWRTGRRDPLGQGWAWAPGPGLARPCLCPCSPCCTQTGQGRLQKDGETRERSASYRQSGRTLPSPSAGTQSAFPPSPEPRFRTPPSQTSTASATQPIGYWPGAQAFTCDDHHGSSLRLPPQNRAIRRHDR